MRKVSRSASEPGWQVVDARLEVFEFLDIFEFFEFLSFSFLPSRPALRLGAGAPLQRRGRDFFVLPYTRSRIEARMRAGHPSPVPHQSAPAPLRSASIHMSAPIDVFSKDATWFIEQWKKNPEMTQMLLDSVLTRGREAISSVSQSQDVTNDVIAINREQRDHSKSVRAENIRLVEENGNLKEEVKGLMADE